MKNTNCEILNQEFHSKGDKLLLLCSDEDVKILNGILKNRFITGERPALISPNSVLSDETILKNDGQFLNFDINKYRGKEKRLVSVRLVSFYFGGSKLARFLSKIEHTPRKLLYFVNRHNFL